MTRDGRLAGFGLVEAIVSLAALTFVFALVFVLISYGVNGFSLLLTRQSLQTQALRFRLRFERDLGLSHFDSLTLQQRGGPASADALGMLGLSNWNSQDCYTAEGLPLWNRQIVYSAEERPDQTLQVVRSEFAPAPPTGYDFLPVRPIPAAVLAAAGDSSPSSSFRLVRREVLAESVESFKCELDPSRQLALVSMRQRQTGGKRPVGAQRSEETFQAVFEVEPLNTAPRL